MKKILLAFLSLSVMTVFSTEESETQKELEGLSNGLKAIANVSLNCKKSKECVSVPFGSKACGGPLDYVYVSKSAKNFSIVSAIAKRVTEVQKQANKESGAISNCAMTMPSKVECSENTCKEVR